MMNTIKALLLTLLCASTLSGQGHSAAVVPHLENIIHLARNNRTAPDGKTLDLIADVCESAEAQVAKNPESNWNNIKVSVKGYADTVLKLSSNLNDKKIAGKIASEAKALQKVQ
jgi:hypothetical protein